MNKLTYSENIGLIANCPTIEKSYRTKEALLEEYEKFKATWMAIVSYNPMEYSTTEINEDGVKAFGLSVNIGNTVITRVVTIEF